MSQWICDSIGAQERLTQGHSYPLQDMVGADGAYRFAPVRHAPFAWDARCLATSSSAWALGASCQASAVARAENLGRARPLDAGIDHRLALAPRAQGGLGGYPSAGTVVGRGSPAALATAQGRDACSRGGWACDTPAGDAPSLGAPGPHKRAAAVGCRQPLCPVDCPGGGLAPPRGLAPAPRANPSGVPDSKRVVA